MDLPLRFFRDRAFATAGLASLLMYSALFGAPFLVAQLLEIGMGTSPWVAGLALVATPGTAHTIRELAVVLGVAFLYPGRRRW